MELLKNFCNGYNEILGNSNDSDDIPCNMTMHKSRKHNFRDIVIFSMMKQGSNSSRFINPSSSEFNSLLNDLYPYDKNKHVDTYVQHAWNKPSNTILAHLQKDGLKFIHPNQPRSFTPYEAALIQSFPKSYGFSGGVNAQHRQVGNAVPPLMAKSLGLVSYDNSSIEIH